LPIKEWRKGSVREARGNNKGSSTCNETPVTGSKYTFDATQPTKHPCFTSLSGGDSNTPHAAARPAYTQET